MYLYASTKKYFYILYRKCKERCKHKKIKLFVKIVYIIFENTYVQLKYNIIYIFRNVIYILRYYFILPKFNEINFCIIKKISSN